MAQAFVGSSPTSRTSLDTYHTFEDYLKSKRLAETTIESKNNIVNQLSHHCNLWNLNEVRNHIERSNWVNGRKNLVLFAYQDWCVWKGFKFDVDKFRESDSKIPFIPKEEQLDALISASSKRYAPLLQLDKESGWRVIELSRLKPSDFDLSRGTAILNCPAKGSLPRQIKMSQRLVSMLSPLIAKTPAGNRIWAVKPRNLGENFSRIRKKTAEKLGDTAINKITLKTFRHFKGTMTYHQTKDILFTMRVLGHKRIENTLVYTHLLPRAQWK